MAGPLILDVTLEELGAEIGVAHDSLLDVVAARVEQDGPLTSAFPQDVQCGSPRKEWDSQNSTEERGRGPLAPEKRKPLELAGRQGGNRGVEARWFEAQRIGSATRRGLERGGRF